MKVRYFLVYEFTPDSKRTAPIGAWILQENGSFDYVFSPDFPEDEQKASDVVNRMLEDNRTTVVDGFLEYWQNALGYDRSASEILDEEVDYIQFFKKMTGLVN